MQYILNFRYEEVFKNKRPLVSKYIEENDGSIAYNIIPIKMIGQIVSKILGEYRNNLDNIK